MQLSKTSWHYKLWLLFEKGQTKVETPTNFCSYFWGTVSRLLLVLVGVAGSIFILSCTSYAAYKHIAGEPITYNNEFGRNGEVWLIIIGVLLAFTGLIFVFGKDNLITKAIKAFIGKYCPKIEWKEKNIVN